MVDVVIMTIAALALVLMIVCVVTGKGKYYGWAIIAFCVAILIGVAAEIVDKLGNL